MGPLPSGGLAATSPTAWGGADPLGLLPDDRRRALPEHVLLDLPRRGLRQLRHERHPMRRLEVREAVARERDQLGVRRRGAGLQDDVCVWGLSPLLVRQPDYRRLLHGGMPEQNALDLEARDVLAATDDHVLDPIAYLDVAVRMKHRRIPGVKPSIAHHLFGRLGVFVVALHDHVAARDDLSQRFAVCGHFLPTFVDHTELTRGYELHSSAGLDDSQLGGAEVLVLGPWLA